MFPMRFSRFIDCLSNIGLTPNRFKQRFDVFLPPRQRERTRKSRRAGAAGGVSPRARRPSPARCARRCRGSARRRTCGPSASGRPRAPRAGGRPARRQAGVAEHAALGQEVAEVAARHLRSTAPRAARAASPGCARASPPPRPPTSGAARASPSTRATMPAAVDRRARVVAAHGELELAEHQLGLLRRRRRPRDSAPQRSPYTLMLLENEFATTNGTPRVGRAARTA